MPKKLILNGHQAKAVADAMCALNNVGARARVYFDNGPRVIELTDGFVLVTAEDDAESYASQGEFFGAYSELMDAAK